MEFDYIIVGGGSGGATLAGRLSEDPQLKICLIEAGGDGHEQEGVGYYQVTQFKGARQTDAIMNAPALAKYAAREVHPVDIADEEKLIANIRARADTTYHPVGTCKMGVDDMAVVDPQLRVHGLSGLRIVDASVFPSLVSGNTNAPTIMIAERAAEWMRGEQAGRCLSIGRRRQEAEAG